MALQLNVKLEPIPDMEYVFKVGGKVGEPPQSLPTVYLPIFWFHSSAALPENMAAPLLILLNMPSILVLLFPTTNLYLAMLTNMKLHCPDDFLWVQHSGGSADPGHHLPEGAEGQVGEEGLHHHHQAVPTTRPIR